MPHLLLCLLALAIQGNGWTHTSLARGHTLGLQNMSMICAHDTQPATSNHSLLNARFAWRRQQLHCNNLLSDMHSLTCSIESSTSASAVTSSVITVQYGIAMLQVGLQAMARCRITGTHADCRSALQAHELPDEGERERKK